MYENRTSKGNLLEPTKLVHAIARIIDEFDFEEADIHNTQQIVFKKDYVPKKQFMALYAINKITTIANH